MVLGGGGICLEYHVLKVSCNLLLNIWFIPFCHPNLYSGSPQKLQDYFVTTTTYAGEQNPRSVAESFSMSLKESWQLKIPKRSWSWRLNFLRKWHQSGPHGNLSKQLVAGEFWPYIRQEHGVELWIKVVTLRMHRMHQNKAKLANQSLSIWCSSQEYCQGRKCSQENTSL